MSQTKKQLVLAAFHNEPVDRVPVGFWYHFLENPEKIQGLGQPEVAEKNISGLTKF